MKDLHIRTASPGDADALAAIYAPYVEKTAITFEYEIPGPEEFAERICRVLRRYPFLAAEKSGEILGYVYAGAFKERAAYDWAVETSIYVREDARGLGVGRRLYQSLEAVLSEQGILNLNACIAYPEAEDRYLTRDSVRFHEKFGYRMVGTFHQCGYKFNRWYHMVWMEKQIGVHKEDQPPVKDFNEVRKIIAEKYGIT